MNNIKEHLYPESEEEVIKILSENPNSQILAGGTDLTLNIDQNIETLVDLHNLPLNYITENEKGFVIGSMTTAYQISIFDKFPDALRNAAFKVGDRPIVHAVTIGGNLAKLYPWCDLPPVLWVLDAKIKLLESSGEVKDLTADEFFSYSREKNVSRRRSFIKEVFLPKPPENSISFYKKFGLTEIDKGQVNLASFFKWKEDGSITDVKIVVSAINKTLERVTDIEKLVLGKKITDDLIKECVAKIGESIEIVPNYKSSKEFRAQILRTYMKRSLQECKSSMEAKK